MPAGIVGTVSGAFWAIACDDRRGACGVGFSGARCRRPSAAPSGPPAAVRAAVVRRGNTVAYRGIAPSGSPAGA